MQLLSLLVIRDIETSKDDDRICFYTEPETSDMVRVVAYYKGNGAVRYTYTMPRDRCAGYLRVLLHSLADDAEPFDNIQLNSAMFPAVMYTVGDLARPDVMSTISELLHITFDVAVRRTCVRRDEDE